MFVGSLRVKILPRNRGVMGWSGPYKVDGLKGCLYCGRPHLMLEGLELSKFCSFACRRYYKWEHCDHDFVTWPGGMWAQCKKCSAVKSLKMGRV